MFPFLYFLTILFNISIILWNTFATGLYNPVTARALHMLAHRHRPSFVAA